MSDSQLHVSDSIVFSGYRRPFEKADYVVIGVPFDATSTYRTGARFAPLAIREASLNIETYSFRSNMDIEDLKIHDLGDLHVSGDVDETLTRLSRIVRELVEAKKTPILLGGEHTLTLGAMRGIGGENLAVLSFDAHLDLRNEYMDLAISHTTFMRRLDEQVKPKKIVEIGTRAVCKEELSYAKKAGIQYFTATRVSENGSKAIGKAIEEAVEDCAKTYLTIDMDVLDPAFAPAVQNPEPEGLSNRTLLDIALDFCDERLACMDLVEVAPPYDQGVTAVQAARILFEALCRIERGRQL